MIVDAILGVFAGLINTALGVLPTWTPVDWDSLSGTGTVFQWLGWANQYVPVDTAATIIGLSAVLWAAIYGAKLTLWILEKLHIAGGSGD